MPDLAKRRLRIADRLFESYQFGSWDLEEISDWHVAKAGDVLCRSIMFCDAERGGPCIRGEFVVRFKTGRARVDEHYATIDGCFVGEVGKAAMREGSKKDRWVRLQISLSATTLAAIDDYRLASRAPNRAGAVRHLLKRGQVAQPSNRRSH